MAEDTPLGVAAPLAAESLPRLVGRLRRWHPNQEWGFVFSDLHQCDVFLDGDDASDGLREGDLVLFEVFEDDYGQLSARGCCKASASEVEQQQHLLQPYYDRYGARMCRLSLQREVFELPTDLATSVATGASPELHGSAGGAAGVAPGGGAVDGTMLQPPMSAAPHVAHNQLGQPPPPPAHPAPTGTSFPLHAQGVMAVAMPQQAQQQQGAVPVVQQDGRTYSMMPQMYVPYSMDGRALQSQGHQGPVAPIQQVPTPMTSDCLMLEGPQALQMLDAKSVAGLFRGTVWSTGKAPTFGSRGAAAQISRGWCEALKTTRQWTPDMDVQASAQQLRRQGVWEQGSAWMWSSSGGAGGPGQGGCDGFNGVGTMGQQGAIGLLGVHGVGGDQSMYSATRAG